MCGSNFIISLCSKVGIAETTFRWEGLAAQARLLPLAETTFSHINVHIILTFFLEFRSKEEMTGDRKVLPLASQ